MPVDTTLSPRFPHFGKYSRSRPVFPKSVQRVLNRCCLVSFRPVGHAFTFTQADQYTFTAQVGNRTSENQIVVSAGSAADNISRFVIKTAVPFLNADSVSRLPLSYEIIDKQSHPLKLLEYAPVRLSVNGVLRGRPHLTHR